MAMTVKVSGSLKSVPYPQVKASGTWKHVQNIYTKVSGAWKPVYAYWFDVGGWGGCSASCGGGTQTRTVQCKRTGDVACDDSFCTRAGLAVPARSQACNTQGCTTCYTRSSSPKTFFGHRSVEYGGSSDYPSYTCKGEYQTVIYKSDSRIYLNNRQTLSSVSVGGYTYTRGGNYSIFATSAFTSFDHVCAHDLCVTPN